MQCEETSVQLMQDIETISHSANHTKEWKRQNKKKLHTRLTNSQIDLGKNKAETLLQLKHENVCCTSKC